VWFPVAATNQPALELIQQQLKAVGNRRGAQGDPARPDRPVQQSGDFDALWGNLTRPTRTSCAASTRRSWPRLQAAGHLVDSVLNQQAATADATSASSWSTRPSS